MGHELSLILVNPGNRTQLYGTLGSTIKGIAPPLGIGLLAAFVRKHGFSVKILDAEAEDLTPEQTAERIAESDPMLAGISTMTTQMTATSEILGALKKLAPQVKTILGGSHPSALSERTIREEKVDFVCQGEGFYPLLQLLGELKGGREGGDYKINGLWYLKEGEVISNPPPPLFKNPDELPFVAWDLLPMDKYRAHHWHCFWDDDKRAPYAVISTSFGCPFHCTYCSVNAVYGKPGIRYRSPEKVIEEGAEVLRFRDKAFVEYFSNPEYIKLITRKFGLKAAKYNEEVLKHRIHRKFA